MAQQIIYSALGNDIPQSYEEEYIYDPVAAKRRAKVPPIRAQSEV
jgi:hypothetical protein